MSAPREAKALRQAEAQIEKADFAGAERTLLAVWPKPDGAPADALRLYGMIRFAQRRVEDARALLQAAVHAAPDSARCHFALGFFLASIGEPRAGADALAETLRLDPHYPNALRAFARASLNADRAIEAEAAARALLAETKDADAWNVLCCALRAQERLEEAADAGEQAISLDPDLIPAQHDWAVVIGRLGRVEEALAAFDQLAARGVTASALAINRAAALSELDRIEEAERVLSEAAVREPFDMAVQSALAKARWRGGAGEEFTADYEDAIARNPNASVFRAGCADLLRAAGLAERAEALVQKGLARKPGDPILLDALGAILDEAGRAEEAAPLLERAVERWPQRDELRTLLVRALLQLGRADEAMTYLSPLREASPLHQGWIAYEALALRQKGDGRYHWLCDYDAMVQAYEVAPPPGFANVAAFNEALADALMKLHVAKAHPLDQSLRHGTQNARNLTQIDDPVVQLYIAALDEPIRAYTSLMRDPDHPWSGRKTGAHKIANAWSVRLRADGFHVNHVHPQGWISSSYYVALPPSVGQEGWIKFGEAPRPMPGCGVEKIVQPKVGALVLFPSYMWHGTIPFRAGERLTAPFDVTPV